MNKISQMLPIHDPLLIFTLLIGIILLSPFLFKLIKVPDVAAFILMGILVGPYGFHLLARDSSIELLGIVGLLYIMFLAGLELDFEKLKLSKKNSIVFGLATFLIPFLLGLIVTKTILKLENNAAILVSIMFSTHTLVAYPIVRKLGVHRDISVLTAVGGTIITDTLVLMILSMVTQDYPDNSVKLEIVKLLLFFGIYTVIVFYSFPRIAQWFFKHIKRDKPVHYLFLLFLVCIASLGARLIGTEPIIGAFIAGLALNRSIPRNSLLMHHIDFVGNILFIPVFLISIGMLIDTRILFSGTYLWFVASVLIIIAFLGKWLAAFLTQKILYFSNTQRNVLFGLSSSHAAATIAIILIAYQKQLIDITIFNATILIILCSSLLASIITQKYGKVLAMTRNTSEETDKVERILVPVSNPASMSNLVSIANCMQQINPGEPIYLLNILNENTSSRENILKLKETLENNVSEFNHLNENLKVITRVDLSISSGIIRAAKEYMVSDIVFGQGEKTSTSQRIFGNIFDHLLTSLQTLYAIRISGNISDYNRFIVHIPLNLEYEPSFPSMIRKLNKLPKAKDEMEFRPENEACTEKLKALLPKKNKHTISYSSTGFNIPAQIPGSIEIFFLLRKQSVSYNPQNNHDVRRIIYHPNSTNQIIVVPGFE